MTLGSGGWGGRLCVLSLKSFVVCVTSRSVSPPGRGFDVQELLDLTLRFSVIESRAATLTPGCGDGGPRGREAWQEGLREDEPVALAVRVRLLRASSV